jgi:hypothetical protein
MFCVHCGHKNEKNKRFCEGCSAPTVDPVFDKFIQPPKQVTATQYRSPIVKQSGTKPWHIIVSLYLLSMLITVPTLLANKEDLSYIALIIVGSMLAYYLYFIPTLISVKRSNEWAIFCLNLFLGWTFVGLVIALVMSVSPDTGKQLDKILEALKS